MDAVASQAGGAERTTRGRMGKLALHLLVLVAGIVALIVVFAVAGRRPSACSWRSILDLEFAGSEHVQDLYACWKGGTPSLPTALLLDSVLVIPVYVAFLWYWCRQARRTAITAHARHVTTAAMAAVFIAGVLDLAENGWLWQVDRTAAASGTAADWTVAFTLPKWILVGFGAFVSVQGVFRTISFARARPHPMDVFTPHGTTAWERNSRLPPDREGSTNTGEPHGIGVAFSGGGIRSASFGIGALQGLQETPVTGPGTTLDDVRYISGVSGGGYLVASRQLLLATGSATEPYRPGSFEVEHVRRHGRYIADSSLEWLEAFARIVAGVALNIGFLVALLYVVGTASGWFQRALLFRTDSENILTTPGMWRSVALTFGIAGVLYVLGVVSRSQRDADTVAAPSVLFKLSALFLATGVVAFALVSLLPYIADVTSDLLKAIKLPSSTVAASGGTLSVLATWLGLRPPTKATLTKWLRDRAEDEKLTSEAETKETERLQRKTWAQRVHLSRWLPGLLLLLTAAFVLARFVARARRIGPGREITLGMTVGSEFVWWLGATVLLLVLFALTDQTSWSLHPYYKRRLATAFAMTRLPGGEVGTFPYRMATTLEEFGHAPRGPKLILGAAANLSGEHAAPGRRALAYVFTSDWVGGPEIGYTTSRSMARGLGSGNEGDTTLTAAMAISGAALASAMGRHSLGSLNAVMAAFNLRLGVWLPSPRYLEHVSVGDVPMPGLRRWSYILRELFGSYDVQDRFLYVTDGGHVENLGLVELLRRRCRTVVCIDCSGGPLTLLEGVRLAYEELGVVIDFPDGYTPVREGSAAPDPSIAKAVAARLAATNVLVGTITYPHLADDLPAATGTIIYARSVLTADTPADVLDHAARNARFPNDPTGDQWFDVEQFNNYVALGRQVGDAAAAALGAVAVL